VLDKLYKYAVIVIALSIIGYVGYIISGPSYVVAQPNNSSHHYNQVGAYQISSIDFISHEIIKQRKEIPVFSILDTRNGEVEIFYFGIKDTNQQRLYKYENGKIISAEEYSKRLSIK
jgi:hypothetical protein